MASRKLDQARILVTRPAGQAETLCRMIEQAGGQAVWFPVIGIEALYPDTSVSKADIMIYVSANAVRHGAHYLDGYDGQVAAIGEATARQLQQQGIPVDILPEQGYDSEALLATEALHQVAGKSIAIIRGEGGREYLAGQLEQRGARVQYIECYRRVALDTDATSLKEQLCADAIDLVAITSIGILDALMASLGDEGCDCLRHSTLLVISERIATCAKQRGFGKILLSSPGDSNMLESMIEWRQRDSGVRKP